MTVYSFEDWQHRPSTAVIDRIYLDLDSKTNQQLAIDEGIRLIDGLDQRHNIQTTQYFSGKKGIAVYIDFNPVPISDENKKEVVKMFQNILKRTFDLTTLDPHVVGDINRVSRVPNTTHQDSGLYCIPITIDDLGAGIDHIRDLARKPRADVPVIIHNNEIMSHHLLEYEQAIITRRELDKESAWMRRARMPVMHPQPHTREENIANKLIRTLKDTGLSHKQRVGLAWLLDDLGWAQSDIENVFLSADGKVDRKKIKYQVAHILNWK